MIPLLVLLLAGLVFSLVKLVVAADPRSEMTIVTATYSHCVAHGPIPSASTESTETCTRTWTWHGTHQDTATLTVGYRSNDGTSDRIINPDAETVPAVAYYLITTALVLTGMILAIRGIRRPRRQVSGSPTQQEAMRP